MHELLQIYVHILLQIYCSRIMDTLSDPLDNYSVPALTSIMLPYLKLNPVAKKLYDKAPDAETELSVYQVVLQNKDKLLLSNFDIVKTNQRRIKAVLREAFLVKNIGAFCDSILKVHDLKLMEKDGKIRIELLSEFPPTPLKRYKGRMDAGTSIQWAYNLCETLTEMERCGVSHMNIKYESLFVAGPVSNKKLKLGNFSSAISFLQDPKQIFQPIDKYAYKITGWTKFYLAPEVLASDNVAKTLIPQKCDVFAFGLTFLELMLYEMDMELADFYDTTPELDKVAEKVEAIGMGKWLSIIKMCLSHNPMERPSFQTIKEEMEKVESGLEYKSIQTYSVEKAEQCIKRDEYHAAVWLYEKCIRENTAPEIKVRLAYLYSKTGEYKKAVETAESIGSLDNKELLLELYTILLDAYVNLAYGVEVQEYDTKLEDLIKEFNRTADLENVKRFELLGKYHELIGEYSKAIELYQAAQELVKDGQLVAIQQNNIARIYLAEYELDKAKQYLDKCEQFIEKGTERSPELWYEFYNNKGLLNAQSQSHNKAIEYYTKAQYYACLLYDEDSPEMIKCYLNIAKSSTKPHWLPKAQSIAQKAFDKAHPIHTLINLAMADSYISSEKYQDALTILLQCENVDAANCISTTLAAYMAEAYSLLEDFEKAAKYMQIAFKNLKITNMWRSPSMAKALLAVGRLELNSMDYEASIKHFEAAKNILQTLYCHKLHPMIPIIDLYICSVNVLTEDISNAYTELKKTKVQLAETYGDNSVWVGKIHQEFANILCKKARFKDAFYRFKSAEKVFCANNKENCREMAELYNCMGTTYREMDQFENSIKYHNKAKGILTRIYGEDSAAVAETHRLIGDACFSITEYKAALEYYKSSERTTSAICGNKIPVVGMIWNRIGEAYCYLSEYEKSIKFHLKAQKLFESLNNVPFLAYTSMCIGENYMAQEKYEDSAKYLSDALNLLKTLQNKHTRAKVRTLSDLGFVYKELNNPSDAANYYKHAEKLLVEAFGEVAKELPDIYYNLGILSEILNTNPDLKVAYKPIIKLYEKSLEIIYKIYGKKHPDAIDICKQLENAYVKAGEKIRSYEIARTMEQIMYKKPEPADPELAQICAMLGAAKNKVREHYKAVKYLKKAANILEKLEGENYRQKLKDTYNHLIFAHTKLCHERKVEKVIQRAKERGITCTIFEQLLSFVVDLHQHAMSQLYQFLQQNNGGRKRQGLQYVVLRKNKIVAFSKKRTHEEMEKAARENSEEGTIHGSWLTENTMKTRHPLVRLHNEVLDFCNYVAPTRAEISQREKAVQMYFS
eukprot:TRINITY_DN513_c0_g1_i3.p1 TRINITY_DN513_c0_g1~~TRINITY_DN513_c0_g1_i3.p1  ORF type:complete len:1302 (-),score=162.38 TRINITY_DN513_c0_g1_i3:3692-7597(-)